MISWYPTGSPAFGPSVWKRIGRQRLSSFIKLEFWKWAIRAAFPWILAYAMDATFSLLNFSHFLPLNAWKKMHLSIPSANQQNYNKTECYSYMHDNSKLKPDRMKLSATDRSYWWTHSPHCICSVENTANLVTNTNEVSYPKIWFTKIYTCLEINGQIDKIIGSTTVLIYCNQKHLRSIPVRKTLPQPKEVTTGQDKLAKATKWIQDPW